MKVETKTHYRRIISLCVQLHSDRNYFHTCLLVRATITQTVPQKNSHFSNKLHTVWSFLYPLDNRFERRTVVVVNDVLNIRYVFLTIHPRGEGKNCHVSQKIPEQHEGNIGSFLYNLSIIREICRTYFTIVWLKHSLLNKCEFDLHFVPLYFWDYEEELRYLDFLFVSK